MHFHRISSQLLPSPSLGKRLNVVIGVLHEMFAGYTLYIYQREWCDPILQVPASEYCTETRNWPNRVLSSEHMVCSSSTSLVNGSNEMSHSARPATVGPPKGHLLSESKRFRHRLWSVWSPLRLARLCPDNRPVCGDANLLVEKEAALMA
jgi:hypothetical protein